MTYFSSQAALYMYNFIVKVSFHLSYLKFYRCVAVSSPSEYILPPRVSFSSPKKRIIQRAKGDIKYAGSSDVKQADKECSVPTYISVAYQYLDSRFLTHCVGNGIGFLPLTDLRRHRMIATVENQWANNTLSFAISGPFFMRSRQKMGHPPNFSKVCLRLDKMC
ncbi:hypothetical protein NPIL_73221 [Nephila pilipes]|uniref:Uncharacterized protein n=1 Tax=Nephila pilipes TaxID=299642 RepID=A0A8X6MRG9_NEPPI|nr:hypothetical protein NPIL_73221 [Nephila pilipes]